MTIRSIILILFAFAVTQSANAQCLTLDNCAATGTLDACDLTPNDPLLWNDPALFSPFYNTHDLPEVPFDGNDRSATNSCANGTTVRFRLFLDLDGNGTQESVLQSTDLAPAGSVWFNNAAAPNYQGSTTASFDNRPVTATDKYQFAIETTIVGNVTSAQLRWISAANPGVFVPVQLPIGIHKIQWIFTDGNSADVICEQNWLVKDCKKPTVVCLNGLSVNIMPTQVIELWATDFLQYAEDNYSASGNLKLGIIKSSESTGTFPVNPDGSPRLKVVFDCSELGTQAVELWAIDEAGNADYCETYVSVMDNNFNCAGNGDSVSFTTCAKTWCDQAVINNVYFSIGGFYPIAPPTLQNVLFNDCDQVLYGNVPTGSLTITVGKDDDVVNGVTVLDLVKISKHILGIDPLPSPYAMLAADANKSGSISAFDIVELTKLLLGIYTELPNNNSWRFIDSSFVFPNPANPWAAGYPQNTLTISNILPGDTLHLPFIGIKVGDVDCSAIPGFQSTIPEDRAAQTLTLPDASLLAGETMELPLSIQDANDWIGLQVSLHLDPQSIVIESIIPGVLPGMTADNIAQPQPGTVNAAWFQPVPQHIASGENMLTIRIRALQPVRLREAISLRKSSREGIASEGYDAHENRQALQLQFRENNTVNQEPARIFAPQPNPTKANVTIPVRLAQPEVVQLEMIDLTGKILYNTQRLLESGAQLLDIPAQAFPNAGVYGWRVRAGAMVASGTIVRY